MAGTVVGLCPSVNLRLVIEAGTTIARVWDAGAGFPSLVEVSPGSCTGVVSKSALRTGVAVPLAHERGNPQTTVLAIQRGRSVRDGSTMDPKCLI